MAIQEHSVGPLYLAKVATNVRRVPVHTHGIIEMEEPWRRGRAIMFPYRPWLGISIGIWTKSINKEIAEDFADEQWLDPHQLEIPIDVIAKWDNGKEEE
jgi:hypothetical protein